MACITCIIIARPASVTRALTEPSLSQSGESANLISAPPPRTGVSHHPPSSQPQPQRPLITHHTLTLQPRRHPSNALQHSVSLSSPNSTLIHHIPTISKPRHTQQHLRHESPEHSYPARCPSPATIKRLIPASSKLFFKGPLLSIIASAHSVSSHSLTRSHANRIESTKRMTIRPPTGPRNARQTLCRSQRQRAHAIVVVSFPVWMQGGGARTTPIEPMPGERGLDAGACWALTKQEQASLAPVYRLPPSSSSSLHTSVRGRHAPTKPRRDDCCHQGRHEAQRIAPARLSVC